MGLLRRMMVAIANRHYITFRATVTMAVEEGRLNCALPRLTWMPRWIRDLLHGASLPGIYKHTKLKLRNQQLDLTVSDTASQPFRYAEKIMKSDKSKQELEKLEDGFRHKLMPRLKVAAEGKDSLLFCVSELNRFREVRPPRGNDELFDVAKKIEAIRRKLVLSDQEQSLAAIYIGCCEEYNDVKNEHRRGSKKLAGFVLKLTADEKA